MPEFSLLHLCYICAFFNPSVAQIPDDWKSYFDESVLQRDLGKTYETRFDKALFQGDINGISLDANENNEELPIAANVMEDEKFRWKDGVIPYNISDSFAKPEKRFIEIAMSAITEQTSGCITFVERTREIDHIRIQRGFSCTSNVGRQGGRQDITLAVGCLQHYGSVQHEIMHALGFFHEMSREDRDDHIIINWNNIEKSNRPQFEKQSGTTLGLLYDFETVMHYPFNAFAIDPNFPTMVPKQKGAKMGQQDNLSPLDIERIKKAYRCFPAETTPSTGISKQLKTVVTTTPSTSTAATTEDGCCPRAFHYCGNVLEGVKTHSCSIQLSTHTLYACIPGKEPELRQSCENGCIDGGAGKNDFCAGYVFRLMSQERQGRRFELKYSAAMDKYVRVISPDQKSDIQDFPGRYSSTWDWQKGWQNLVYLQQNMRREVENDWKQAYLAREYNTASSKIQWHFDFHNSGLRLTNLRIQFPFTLFLDGVVSAYIKLSKADHIPLTGLSQDITELGDVTSFSIIAELTGGHGGDRGGWQCTQLFRQDLNLSLYTSDATLFPFQVSVDLEPLEKTTFTSLIESTTTSRRSGNIERPTNNPDLIKFPHECDGKHFFVVYLLDGYKYTNAVKQCARSGGRLLRIKTKGMEDCVIKESSKETAIGTNYWVGLRRIGEGRNDFIWSDGSALEDEDFINWDPGYGTGSLHRVQTGVFWRYYTEGSLVGYSGDCCKNEDEPWGGYYCEATSTSSETDEVPDRTIFPIKCNSKFLYFSNTLMTYVDATIECSRSKGRLIRLENKEMSDCVEREIHSADGAGSDLWIGLLRIDHNNSDFIWTDGSLLEVRDFKNWVNRGPPAAPANRTRTAVFLRGDKLLKWDEQEVSTSLKGYVCEFR